MPLAPRDIDYFLEVARLGQLSQAAANLDVTAAALSKAIRRLEEEMGLRLFERSGQGMALTPFGSSFRERAQRLHAEHEDALRHAGDVRAGRAGQLRLGATVAVLDTVLAPALARLQPRRPGLHAVLTVASSDQILERTRQGSLDASVLPTYERIPHDLEHEVVGADELVAVAREAHPLFARKRLALGQLADGAWILPRSGSAARAQLDAVFRAAGVEPPAGAVEVEFHSSLSLPLVAATELLALVPRSALRTPAARGVRVVELSALRLARTISLFSRQGMYRSPLLKDFAQALKELRLARR